MLPLALYDNSTGLLSTVFAPTLCSRGPAIEVRLVNLTEDPDFYIGTDMSQDEVRRTVEYLQQWLQAVGDSDGG